jgi:TPR repeat protein
MYKSLANRGSELALYHLGCIYNDGKVIEKNEIEAVKCWKKGSELGDPNSQYNLGYMYEHGNGTEQNYKEAIKWYSFAAESGSDCSQYNLGVIYQNGYDKFQPNLKEAIYWYELAANQNYIPAQYNLGWVYSERGELQDFIKAYMWWNICALNGDENAALRLETLREKILTPVQIKKAEKLTNAFIANLNIKISIN